MHKNCSTTKATSNCSLILRNRKPAKSYQVKSYFCCQITVNSIRLPLIPRHVIAPLIAAIRSDIHLNYHFSHIMRISFASVLT